MSEPRRVAAIDIGTNTVLLLIAELREGGPVAVEEHATITRLGAGVDRSRRLSAQACARTLACLSEYATAIASARVERLDVVGTSALRDAGGGHEFIAEAARLLGTSPRVISGEEEAALTFRGALSGLSVNGDVVVFDIGGGSTEIIEGRVGERGYEIVSARSFDVGSVRLHERHITSDPPAAADLANAERDIENILGAAPSIPEATLVGVAGTVTTLAAMSQRLEPYDGAKVHGSALDLPTVTRLIDELARTKVAERSRLPGLDEKRADVILTGALIARAVLGRAGAEQLLVSDRGVRWGLVHRSLDAIGP